MMGFVASGEVRLQMAVGAVSWLDGLGLQVVCGWRHCCDAPWFVQAGRGDEGDGDKSKR